MKIKSFMKIQLGQHVARWNYVPAAAAAAYQSLFVSWNGVCCQLVDCRKLLLCDEVEMKQRKRGEMRIEIKPENSIIKTK